MIGNTQEFNATKGRMDMVVTANLTTNSQVNEIVQPAMTAKELRQQIQFRACLATAVLHKARGRIKEEIRAEGKKVSWFSACEISVMAEELLKKPGERERMIADCEGWVRELVFKAKRR